MKINPLTVAKFAVSAVVGMGTHKIVSGFIKNNTPDPKNLLDKVTILAAGWVVSGIATTATKKYADETVDDLVKQATDLYTTIQVKSKLARVNRGESTLLQEGLDPEKFYTCADGKWHPIEEKTDDTSDNS